MKCATRAEIRRGFSLYEALLAIVLLGISVFPLVEMNSDTTKQRNQRQNGTSARLILENEVARLRSTDPTVTAVQEEKRYNASGQRLRQASGQWCGDSRCYTAGNTFTIETKKRVECNGGAVVIDNTDAIPDAEGCENKRPTTVYRIVVRYASRNTEGQDSVTQEITAGRIGNYNQTEETAP